MQKALFLLSIPPPVHGASMMGQYIKESRLINESFQITYINLNTSTTVDEIGKNGLKKVVKMAALLGKVVKVLLTTRPDFTYMTPTAAGVGFYKDWPLAMACKLFSRQLIVHYHNKGISDYQNKTLDNWLYKIFFKKTKVILLAKELFSDVQKYVKKEEVYYCPNGIPNPGYSRSEKTEKEPLQVLFLSNLLKEKGVYDLLDAVNLLKEKGAVFTCILVGGEGDISEAALYQKIKDLRLSENVHYLGKKYGMEKLSIIQSSDIFVFPTYYKKECLPLVILEAMSFGLPIITTTEGGIPSLIENERNGLLVEAKNPYKLSLAIQKLLNDQELRSLLGNSAKMDFTTKFTLEKFEGEFLNMMKKITS
ncbi:glycosyltransferase family 4 protein [Algoriphagus confluentis]|uniref:Glycosyltransferase family 4 protein n=1 Tax=Algoriphagus confluentis TaxID=1697556 RepID=A0ABQ6PNN1_9BACT|nr:glycosyltransferase family 4 protein [Algoriphagus confluentis]